MVDQYGSVWSECLKHLNKKLIQEPRNRYCNSDDRPNIAVFDISTGSSYEKDLLWPTHGALMCSQELPMRMVQQHSEQRRGSTQSIPGGYISECIPLVFEHFGRWGWEAQKFFINISKSSVDEDGKHNSTEFKTWRRRLSIELQRCNAQVIIRKLSRANQSRDSSTHTGTYSNQFYL